MVTKVDEQKLRERLGAELLKARLAIGYTQADVAEKAITDPETISRFERGSTLPSLTRLLDLSSVLQVSIASLLGAASPNANDESIHLATQISLLPSKERRFIRHIVSALLHDVKGE